MNYKNPQEKIRKRSLITTKIFFVFLKKEITDECSLNQTNKQKNIGKIYFPKVKKIKSNF